MDPEKIVKFTQEYVRDYVFAVFGTLLPSQDEGSPEEVLTFRNPRTFVFAAIGVLLGSGAYAAALGGVVADAKTSAPVVAFTLALWLAFGALSHLIARIVGGTGAFSESMGCCLRVLPVAYLLGGFVALTKVMMLGKGADDEVAWALIGCQCLVLAIYLPGQLGRAHDLKTFGIVELRIILPAIFLTANVAAYQNGGQIMMGPPPPPSPLTLVVHLVGKASLSTTISGVPMERVLAPEFLRVIILEPAALGEEVSKMSPGDRAVFDDYRIDERFKRLKAQIEPLVFLADSRTDQDAVAKLAANLCVRRLRASWREIPQLSVSCTYSGACMLDDADERLSLCSDGPKTAQQQPLGILDAFAPRAHASPVPTRGWVIPDLVGACLAYRDLQESFYRFDVRSPAPPKAAQFSYALAVNGKPLFVNAEDAHLVRGAVVNGSSTVTFALQNIAFSGQSGATGGEEAIHLALRFYDAQGRQIRDQDKASTYPFVALRGPAPLEIDGMTWNGAFVIGRVQNGRQILVTSGKPGQDMRPAKRWLEEKLQGHTYEYDGQRMTAVGVIRPPLLLPHRPDLRQNPNPGLDLALKGEDGRLRFTFPKEQADQIASWYNGVWGKDKRLSEANVDFVEAEDAVAAEQVCPKLPVPSPPAPAAA